MTVEHMRTEVSKAYNSPKWKYRVEHMEDRQVIAIYKDMAAKGRFGNNKKKKEPGIKRAEQLTIFDELCKPQQEQAPL